MSRESTREGHREDQIQPQFIFAFSETKLNRTERLASKVRVLTLRLPGPSEAPDCDLPLEGNISGEQYFRHIQKLFPFSPRQKHMERIRARTNHDNFWRRSARHKEVQHTYKESGNHRANFWRRCARHTEVQDPRRNHTGAGLSQINPGTEALKSSICTSFAPKTDQVDVLSSLLSCDSPTTSTGVRGVQIDRGGLDQGGKLNFPPSSQLPATLGDGDKVRNGDVPTVTVLLDGKNTQSD